MAVIAHAQENKVETRKLTRSQTEGPAQLGFVLERSAFRIGILSLDAVDLFRPQPHSREHGFVGHAEIAFLLFRPGVALITKEKTHLRPRYLPPQIGVAGQQRVESFWCRAAGKRDGA